MENKDPQEQGPIEGLEQGIYSREFKTDVSPRSTLSPDSLQIPVEKEWKHEPITLPKPPVVEPLFPQKKKSIVKKIFVISAIFFVLCAAAAVFIFYGGLNIVSTNKVEVTFEGPVSIAAGDELSFDVLIHNQNGSALVHPVLYIDYPDGTKEATQLSQDLLHTNETLEDIPAKTDVRHTVRAVLFGRERSEKDITVTLEYGIKASNGDFKKENTYKVNISSTPLTMNITHPAEMGSGQNVSFNVDIISNSNVPLTNLALRADYPRGFTFTNSNPEALDTVVWKIPTLKPGEKKTITINGKIDGEENDEKVFRFNVGINDPLNDKAIATSFLATTESVVVRRPPLAVNLTLNGGSSANTTISPGDNVAGQITITNNMKVQIVNINADLILGGTALDPTSPNASGALYRLPTKTISWDKTTLGQLGALDPGANVVLNFSLGTVSQSALSSIKNGQITLAFKAAGTAIDSGQPISANFTQTTKVQPTFRVTPQITYSTGPFKNTGNVPPKAETKTTYTITWKALQTSDEIGNVEIHGSLPSYVKWLNVISPANASVQWYPEHNEIVWQAGTIPAGKDGMVAKEVSFQVEFYPSYSQIGTIPTIVDNVWFKGTDTFTGVPITSGSTVLTTYLYADPLYNNQPGKVTE